MEPSTVRHPGRRLTQDQKLSIAALVIAGHSKTKIAQQLDTTRETVKNTVDRLAMGDKPGEHDIRTQLLKLNNKAGVAIERSLDDTTEPHKAAGTAIAHLKGMGVYAADIQQNVVISQQVGALPEDWQSRYVNNTSMLEKSHETKTVDVSATDIPDVE